MYQQLLASGGIGMDALRAFLEEVKRAGVAESQFLGLLHILIGRKITKEDGSLVSGGLTWREAAAALKKVRWDKNDVKQLDIDSSQLAPRDRERFWYMAIARSHVDSNAAKKQGDQLAAQLRKIGYIVGPAPGSS